VSRDRRLPRHERGGKVVPLFPDAGEQPGRVVRLTAGQLLTLTDVFTDAIAFRDRAGDPDGGDSYQALAQMLGIRT
jgi:hypothetical protein